jgi:hypothetical protein
MRACSNAAQKKPTEDMPQLTIAVCSLSFGLLVSGTPSLRCEHYTVNYEEGTATTEFRHRCPHPDSTWTCSSIKGVKKKTLLLGPDLFLTSSLSIEQDSGGVLRRFLSPNKFFQKKIPLSTKGKRMLFGCEDSWDLGPKPTSNTKFPAVPILQQFRRLFHLRNCFGAC